MIKVDPIGYAYTLYLSLMCKAYTKVLFQVITWLCCLGRQKAFTHGLMKQNTTNKYLINIHLSIYNYVIVTQWVEETKQDNFASDPVLSIQGALKDILIVEFAKQIRSRFLRAQPYRRAGLNLQGEQETFSTSHPRHTSTHTPVRQRSCDFSCLQFMSPIFFS